MEEHASRIMAELARAADVENREPMDVIRHIAETAARTLGVARVNVWLYDDERSTIRCIDDFDAVLEEHTSGAVLRAQHAPAYFAALEVLRDVASFDVATDPRTQGLGRYLRAHRVTTMLDAPLLRSGHVVGVVCHEDTGAPRIFQPWERAFAAGVGDLVSLVLETERRVRAEREQRRLEAVIARHEQVRSLGMLAAGVAHDFRTLLTLVQGNVELARSEPGGIEERLSAIERATDRAAELCELLLTWSGRAPRADTAVALGPLVDELVHLLRVRLPTGVRVVTTIASDLPAFRADATQVRQVVLSLLTNAIDAVSAGGGEVRVSALVDDGPPPDAEAYDFRAGPGRAVCLVVDDDGIGMEPEVARRAFEPFWTTKQTGTGFGLSTVLGVVRGHEGALAVRTTPRGGTTFRVWWPLG